MSAGVESVDADVNDRDGRVAFGVELFDEVGGSNGLRGRPWVGVRWRRGAGIRAAKEVRGGTQQ